MPTRQEYRALVHRLFAGEITPEEFREAVQRLRDRQLSFNIFMTESVRGHDGKE